MKKFQKGTHFYFFFKKKLVGTLGVCIDPIHPICIVTEICEEGSLRDLFIKTSLNTYECICLLSDIARYILIPI